MDLSTLTAIFAGVAGAGTLVLAAISVWTLRELKTARLQQFRPNVYVDIENDESLLLVALRNDGPVGAYRIQITFDPPLIRQAIGKEKESRNLGDFPVFTHTGFLSPGRRIPITFWMAHQFYSDDSLPKTYTVSLRYEASDGRVFLEEGLLDFSALRDARIASL